MSAQNTRRTLIAWVILALILTQGLRLCIHAYDAPHVATHAHDAAAPHIESDLSFLDDHDEAMSDTHITLIGILKHIFSEPLIAALFMVLLFGQLTQQSARWRARPRDRVFRPPHGHYFSPPLRAPPR